MAKVALITGITGQDGAYLADLLLHKGYEVHGLRQPVAVPDTDRLQRLLGDRANDIHLHYGDMTDGASVTGLISRLVPDEIYNLAAQSHVHISFAVPDQTLQVNGGGALRVLEAVRLTGLAEKTKIFHASTSELFGDAPPSQNEDTPMNPRSPYAAAKLYAYHMVRIYREAYGLHASNGIMFNHESPFRGGEFVTQKIVTAAARIVQGQQNILYLGNLDARRDWSHARDIMEAAWLMLQQDEPDDYIVSSGQSRTVRNFATEAFKVAGIQLGWRGEGLQETGVDVASGKVLIRIDPALFRPLEVENLMGNSAKIRECLGWRARTDFSAIVREMVETELRHPGEVIPDVPLTASL